MLRTQSLVVTVLFVVAAGCGSSTPQTPSTPTTTNFTEVFSGTINPNGAASHPFISQGSGTAQATLTLLAPDAAGTIGISLGTWSNSACQIIIANDKATLLASVRGQVGAAGQLCARVYDVGGVGSPQTYELTVVHP